MRFYHKEVPLGPLVDLNGPEDGTIFSMPQDDIPFTATPKLCSLCTQLTLSRLINKALIAHQPSFKALNESAAAGCYICMLFRSAVLEKYMQHSNGRAWSENRVVEFQLWRDEQDRHDERGFALQYLQDPDRRCSAHLGVAYVRHPRPYSWNGQTLFDESTENEDVNDSIMDPTLLLSTFKPSNSTVNGRPITDTVLRKRIIDVGDGATQHPRLVESQGMRGKYLTLSHCWGSSRPLVTDSGNYADHLVEISYEKLPATFKDATTVTRNLGFRYVWIHSLCIIQDSRQDWQEQCACMHQIYQNSALTVAAAATTSSQFHFLLERMPAPVLPCVLPSSSESHLQADVLLSLSTGRNVSRTHGTQKECQSPLSFRGWGVQERLLSAWVLYLGSHQAYFECKNELWYECTWERGGPNRHEVRGYYWSLSKKDFDSLGDLKRKWTNLVSIYTRCDLTYPEDKLPALSGIARKISEQDNDIYLAGLWLKDLALWMTWYAVHPSDYSDSNHYIPSWSWAKLDAVRITIPKRARSRQDPVVLDAATSLAGQDDFGDVVSGKVVLQGRLRVFVENKKKHDGEGCRTLECADQTLNDVAPKSDSMSWWLDHAPTEGFKGVDQVLPVQCLLLTYSIGENFKGVTVLTLEPVDGMPDTFRRTGTAYGSEYEGQHKNDLEPFEALFPRWNSIERQQVILI